MSSFVDCGQGCEWRGGDPYDILEWICNLVFGISMAWTGQPDGVVDFTVPLGCSIGVGLIW